jgi:hypothetical protein
VFKRHKKMFGVIAAIVVAAATFGAQAFTASNTVPQSDAGSGSELINPYTVSGITYTTTGNKITNVKFNLNKAATDVKVQFTALGSWYDCGAATGGTFAVDCTASTPAMNEDAEGADQLSVTASQ